MKIPGGVTHRVVRRLELVDIDHKDCRRGEIVLACEGERPFEAVVEKLAVGQAGQVVVDGVMQKPLLSRLRVRHVGQRADHPDDLPIAADDGPRLEAEPVMRA